MDVPPIMLPKAGRYSPGRSGKSHHGDPLFEQDGRVIRALRGGLRRSLAAFVGQHGTVTAMFEMPHGSCTVQLDNYVDQPDLFLNHIEAVQCVVRQTHYLAGSIRNQKRTTA